jgi:hypothetical protein
MRYQIFGRTGCRVSALGFGCIRLPVKNGDDGHILERDAIRLVHHAIERGVNYFDTAYSYHRGNSEPLLGRALRGHYRLWVLSPLSCGGQYSENFYHLQ